MDTVFVAWHNPVFGFEPTFVFELEFEISCQQPRILSPA